MKEQETEMGKLSVLLVVMTAFFLVPTTASSARTAQITVEADKPACTQIRFHNIGRYAHQRWDRVFRDKEVAPALRGLLKKNYRKLIESMTQASYPEDLLSFVDRKGVLTLRGFVPGLFTIMEAILIVEPCGNIYAAILDEGERFLYFSNDREYIDRLPAEVERWRSDRFSWKFLLVMLSTHRADL
jgi:hypothetical protein